MENTYQNQLNNALLQLHSQEKREVIHDNVVKNDIKDSQFITSQPAKFSPIAGVRSSEPDNNNSGFMGKNSVLTPDFALKHFEALEYFAVHNRHISYAIENIVTLASTEYEISFSDKMPSALQQKMKSHIRDRADNYYEFAGGLTVLINDFFTQLSIFGALSFEKVVDKNLKGIKKVVRVSPKWIRAIYDQYEDTYSWVQQPRWNTSRATLAGYIPLNPNTYTYLGLRHVSESPYGVPPFLSALEDIITEYDMIGSFKTMMKKMGMLGLLSVLVNAPEQRTEETEEQYYQRVSSFLKTEIVPEAEKQMAKGVAVGIKGGVEFKLEGQNMNTAGAEQLMKIIKSMIYAGMKQDPNLHGENYSVTETFGRVILSKMSMQMRNYQQLVAKALEEIFMLDLVLAGYNPGYIEVKFKMPSISDQLKDEQAEQIKIANVLSKRDAGIIDQTQAANELGYDEPAEKEAPQPVAPVAAQPKIDKKAADTSNTKELNDLILKMKGDSSQYDYSIISDGEYLTAEKSYPIEGKVFTYEGADLHDDFLTKQENKYNKEIEAAYSKAVSKAVSALEKELNNSNRPYTESQMTDLILVNLYKDWDKNFSQEIDPIIKKYVSSTYEHYRKDKSIFKSTKTGKSQNSFFTAPDGMFSLPDFRTVDYLERSDDFYLGKFIADKDTRTRIIKWVNAYYIENGNPIGKDENLITEFLKEFKELADLESYKIRRITETTLNKSRNYASVMYIEQAKVAKFEIVEVSDQKTCEWCAHMNGKTFEVATAVSLIKEVVASPVEDVPDKTPFATSIKIDDFKKLDSSELEKLGIMTPPYHGHCRGRIVADI